MCVTLHDIHHSIAPLTFHKRLVPVVTLTDIKGSISVSRATCLLVSVKILGLKGGVAFHGIQSFSLLMTTIYMYRWSKLQKLLGYRVIDLSWWIQASVYWVRKGINDMRVILLVKILCVSNTSFQLWTRTSGCNEWRSFPALECCQSFFSKTNVSYTGCEWSNIRRVHRVTGCFYW